MKKVTMREIAEAVNKPESTIYRWKRENPALYVAVLEYAERLKDRSVDKPIC